MMAVRAVAFDLDDTLYDEMTYVESGFRAVALFLQREKGIPADEMFEKMMRELAVRGRGRVFDEALAAYGMRTAALVRRCVGVYRSHKPGIRLYGDAVRCLDRLARAGIPVYIVTDGNKHVQRAKLEALGLYGDPRVKKCYITRRYGIRHEKPSPYCFLHICRLEKAAPEEVAYVGDNPHKDFVGIKPLGFRTVRILRGGHAGIRKPERYEAELEIRSLDEFDISMFSNGNGK
mgnify:CR=1 FL=1